LPLSNRASYDARRLSQLPVAVHRGRVGVSRGVSDLRSATATARECRGGRGVQALRPGWRDRWDAGGRGRVDLDPRPDCGTAL